MSFQGILEELRGAVGATGAVMVDSDGEVVASAPGPDGADMELVGAHLALIMGRIKEAGSMIGGGGDVESVVISTGSSRLVISALKEDYSLVVLLPMRVSSGKALFECGRAVEVIEKEMG